jgi:hypothetical protein
MRGCNFGRIGESRCDAASVRFVAPSADVDPNLWSPIIADPLRARSALPSADPTRSNPSQTFALETASGNRIHPAKGRVGKIVGFATIEGRKIIHDFMYLGFCSKSVRATTFLR